MSPNVAILLTFAVALVALVTAELVGIVRNGEHRLDTISEVWWSVRDRVGPFRAYLSASLAVGLVWLWWHFTYEGGRPTPRA